MQEMSVNPNWMACADIAWTNLQSCKIERGWTCNSQANPSTCTTTCGDGIKAGSEQCDSGQINGLGRGCSANCTILSGAVCTTDSVTQSSVCRLCGNGLVDPGELCDDAKLPGGCADNCSHVHTGWHCSSKPQAMGTNITGFFTSVCIDGPPAPEPPLGLEATVTSIVWRYAVPSISGMPLALLTLQYSNASSSFTTWSQVTITNLTTDRYTLTGLVETTAYKARISACTNSKCSNFSLPSASITTSAAPAAQTLVALSSVLNDEKSLSSLGKASNLTVLSVAAAVPQPELVPVIVTTTTVAATPLQTSTAQIPAQTPAPALEISSPSWSSGICLSYAIRHCDEDIHFILLPNIN
jgi:cysteine-rich repeat protein